MVGHRVEDLVKGWIQRSYLERDGWWAQLVLDEFALLDDLGFSLVASSWAGVHFHQKGHYVGFVGPRRDIAVDYDPDDPKRVTIGASLVEHDPPGSSRSTRYLPSTLRGSKCRGGSRWTATRSRRAFGGGLRAYGR